MKYFYWHDKRQEWIECSKSEYDKWFGKAFTKKEGDS